MGHYGKGEVDVVLVMIGGVLTSNIGLRLVVGELWG